MAIRVINKTLFRAMFPVALDDVTGSFQGTHVGPPGRTGTLVVQLDPMVTELDALKAPSPNRSGQLTPTLDGVTASITGTSKH